MKFVGFFLVVFDFKVIFHRRFAINVLTDRTQKLTIRVLYCLEKNTKAVIVNPFKIRVSQNMFHALGGQDDWIGPIQLKS